MPSPFGPTSGPVTNPPAGWLYIPMANIVVPIGTIAPTQVSFRLLENGVDVRATESGDLRITEQYILP